MTTIDSTVRPAPTAARSQLSILLSHRLRDLLRTIAIALGVTLVVLVVARVVGDITNAIENGKFIFTSDDGEIVSIDVLPSMLGILAGSSAIAAFVHHIVLAAQDTRIEIANGVTRKNIVLANIVTALAGAVAITLLGALAYGVERWLSVPSENSVIGSIMEDGGVGVGQALGYLGLGALSLMIFGLAAGMVFIRFPWYVGVVALVILVWVIPTLAEGTNWAWLDWLTSFHWGTAVLSILGFGAVGAAMTRDVAVP